MLFHSESLLHATGPGIVPETFTDGGYRVEMAPEFFWADLMTRLAKNYPVKERAVLPKKVKREDLSDNEPEDYEAMTARIQRQDVKAAIASGYLKASNKKEYLERLDNALEALSGARTTWSESDENDFSKGLGAENENVEPRPSVKRAGKQSTPAPQPATELAEAIPFLAESGDSEFLEYIKGALSYYRGERDEADKIWTGLLESPRGKRIYRSTWAAYMLARMAFDTKDYDRSIAGCQKVRELARAGCADSLGLGSLSYGLEARCMLRKGEKEKAAELYLKQLASGDYQAIPSLKMCLPTHENHFDSEDIKNAAKSLLMRDLVTSFMLSNWLGYPEDVQEWLKEIERLKVKKISNAEFVAWMEYSIGDYKMSEAWLKLADPISPYTQWLQAKFALRKGDFKKAGDLLAGVMKSSELAETDINKIPQADYIRTADEYGDMLPALQPFRIRSEYACCLMAQGRFTEAETYFRQSGNDYSAGYVREYLFTLPEHKAWLDLMKNGDVAPNSEKYFTYGIHGDGGRCTRKELLLVYSREFGRRLMRLGRLDEAKRYLLCGDNQDNQGMSDDELSKMFNSYSKAFADNQKVEKSPEERAYSRYALACTMASPCDHKYVGWDSESPLFESAYDIFNNRSRSIVGGLDCDSERIFSPNHDSDGLSSFEDLFDHAKKAEDGSIEQRSNLLVAALKLNPNLELEKFEEGVDAESKTKELMEFTKKHCNSAVKEVTAARNVNAGDFKDYKYPFVTPLFIPLTPVEKERLKLSQTVTDPVKEYYLGKEIDLLMEAAKLLPDTSDDKKEILHQAWMCIQAELYDVNDPSDLNKKKVFRLYVEKHCPDLADHSCDFMGCQFENESHSDFKKRQSEEISQRIFGH
ncbi:MAG: hypothetical protein D4R65_10300 [Verrucomicrobiaceae bacterium]|nr:MAG: hypothetical protein D4R65_10300 [Verrucomicrobiaceae bacterium]